ncbi:TonB-dependent receptor [Emcibacter nanhaiensis]|uniref:TonB-dependent receptor n=1 Tax=Emcibacter nanhaiensis TaxID=1505037 RepID=A0A501PJ07_9PROT|nr:TonB-dependent receptor [Emcibacter nanhaiensis]TPD60205.1 TonB-dependent receptor [Emcibacter nanhaiensis]
MITEKLHRFLSSTSLVILSIAANQALAQESQSSADAENTMTLEEIVVTAQFREGNLQKTPLSITAVTGDGLRARGMTNAVDIGNTVPNAVIQPLGAGFGATAAAFIRGVGLGDVSLSYEPAVPIYLDGVYLGRPQGAFLDLLDLDRVEVLRGPQGTLSGKNAVGGAINLISRKPEGSGEGFVEARIGSDNRMDLKGSFDVALSPDKLFARISAASKTADGYHDILDYECVNGAGSLGAGTSSSFLLPGILPADLGSTATGDNCVVDTLGDENVQSGRLALRYIASDDVEILLSGDYTRQRQKGPSDKYTILADNGLNDAWAALVTEPLYGSSLDSRFVTDSPYTSYHRYGTDPISGRTVPNINNLDHWGVAATIDWDIADDMNLSATTSYRRFFNAFGRDSDGSPLPNNFTYDETTHKQFTQEVRLSGTTGALDWTVGGFYYWADDTNEGWGILYPGLITAQDAVDSQKVKSWALFFHGIYQVTEDFSVTGGARYTHDSKDIAIDRYNFLTGTYAIDNAQLSIGAERVTPMLSLNYQVTPDVMTYALYSRGFRGGGYSPRPANALQVAAFDPETVDNFEVGMKSQWLDGRLRLNLAGFYSKYKDMVQFKQFAADDPDNPSGANWFRALNTAQSHFFGLELEMNAELTSNMHIDGSVGWIDYTLEDDGGAGFCQTYTNGKPCLAPRTPTWTASIGADYTIDLGQSGTLTPRVDVRYQSRIFFLASTEGATYSDINGQAPYATVNGNITWRSADEDWEVSVYGRNLSNIAYFQGKLSLVGAFGREQGSVARPRELGVTLRRNF